TLTVERLLDALVAIRRPLVPVLPALTAALGQLVDARISRRGRRGRRGGTLRRLVDIVGLDVTGASRGPAGVGTPAGGDGVRVRIPGGRGGVRVRPFRV